MWDGRSPGFKTQLREAQHWGLWSASWPLSGKEEHPDSAAQRLQNDTDPGLEGTESGGSWLAACLHGTKAELCIGWLV